MCCPVSSFTDMDIRLYVTPSRDVIPSVRDAEVMSVFNNAEHLSFIRKIVERDAVTSLCLLTNPAYALKILDDIGGGDSVTCQAILPAQTAWLLDSPNGRKWYRPLSTWVAYDSYLNGLLSLRKVIKVEVVETWPESIA